MFLLLGVLPILTALIGFLGFQNPDSSKIAGSQTINVSNTPTPSPSGLEAPPGWQPTPTSNPAETQNEISSSAADIHVYPYKTPTTVPSPVSSDNSLDLLSQINNFRTSKGLSTLTANDEVCFFAKLRANEISSNFNHDGFRSRIDNNTLPYSSWSEVAENIALNPNPAEVVEGWINSPGHNENLSKNVPYGCVANLGHYYVFEAMNP